MTLQPLLDAAPQIGVHAFAAMAAFAIGIVQFVRSKGDTTHRVIGYAWVALMLAVAGTSLFIHTINQWRGFSLIHLLSLFVLVMLPLAVWHARAGRIEAHRRTMIGIFVGGLVIAGGFTFMPGRLMYQVVTGH